MQRFLLLLVVALASALTACGANPSSTSDAGSTADQAQPSDQTTSTSNTGAGETATTPSQPFSAPPRGGEIPPDPKALEAGYGLTQVGQAGGKVVLSVTSGPKTLNNLITQETSSSDITRLMNRGLVEVNPVTFEIEPALATRWEFSDDHRVVTFYLRQGVKFSDGKPFSADDVVFTFNDLIFNPDVNTDVRETLLVKGQPIQVEKVDEFTVKVTTVEPFRPLLRALGGYETSIYPKHLMADKVAKLNPGARGAMRAIRQVFDGNADALKTLSADAAQLLDMGLQKLDQVIGAKDVQLTTAAAMGIQSALEQLAGLLGADQTALREALQKSLEQIGKVAAYAAQGLWEGVSPDAFNNAWTVDTPAEQFAGLGPFSFVRYDVDQQVILQRNPYYWKVDASGVQLPYLEQIVILVVESLDVSFLKFKTGETDAYEVRPQDWPLLVEGVSEQDCRQAGVNLVCPNAPQGWELIRGGPQFGTLYVVLNQDVEDPVLQAVFRDLQFRKAVAHAIDKQSIIDNIYNGLALPQGSPVSFPSPYYDQSESFATYPLDLEASRQLLDEIGLTDTDGDGVRNISDAFLEHAGLSLNGLPAADERELEFLFSTNSGNTLRERVSTFIASDLKKVGINPTFKPIEFNALVTDLLGGKYQMVLIGFTGGVEPNDSANIWTTPGGLHFWRFSAKENPPAWEKRVDELFELGATTFDEDQVKGFYREYQQLVAENLPLIYTVNQQFLYASKAGLANNDAFQPITGNVKPELAFAEVLWWQDPARRAQIENVEGQR